MFNNLKKIAEQKTIIRNLNKTIKSWVEANRMANKAWDAQTRLVQTLKQTIELYKKRDQKNIQIGLRKLQINIKTMFKIL